jgi:hypothetical protein
MKEEVARERKKAHSHPWRKEAVAMMSPSTIILTGFVTWTLLLLVLMEILRTQLVLRGKVPANGFAPDNAGLSPFLQRLARAHAYCIEGLPVFGGLLVVAVVAGRAGVTDPLAFCSSGHGCSSRWCIWSRSAVKVRFGAFAVQMGIGVYWGFALLGLV